MTPIRWISFAACIIVAVVVFVAAWSATVLTVFLHSGLWGDPAPDYRAEFIAHAQQVRPWFLGFVVLDSLLMIALFGWTVVRAYRALSVKAP